MFVTSPSIIHTLRKKYPESPLPRKAHFLNGKDLSVALKCSSKHASPLCAHLQRLSQKSAASFIAAGGFGCVYSLDKSVKRGTEWPHPMSCKPPQQPERRARFNKLRHSKKVVVKLARGSRKNFENETLIMAKLTNDALKENVLRRIYQHLQTVYKDRAVKKASVLKTQLYEERSMPSKTKNQNRMSELRTQIRELHLGSELKIIVKPALEVISAYTPATTVLYECPSKEIVNSKGQSSVGEEVEYNCPSKILDAHVRLQYYEKLDNDLYNELSELSKRRKREVVHVREKALDAVHFANRFNHFNRPTVGTYLTGGPKSTPNKPNHERRLSKEALFFLFQQIILIQWVFSECGICINDNKSENILIKRRRFLLFTVHFTDFGLAQVAKRRTLNTSGTRGFLPPEAWCSKPYKVKAKRRYIRRSVWDNKYNDVSSSEKVRVSWHELTNIGDYIISKRLNRFLHKHVPWAKDDNRWLEQLFLAEPRFVLARTAQGRSTAFLAGGSTVELYYSDGIPNKTQVFYYDASGYKIQLAPAALSHQHFKVQKENGGTTMYATQGLPSLDMKKKFKRFAADVRRTARVLGRNDPFSAGLGSMGDVTTMPSFKQDAFSIGVILLDVLCTLEAEAVVSKLGLGQIFKELVLKVAAPLVRMDYEKRISISRAGFEITQIIARHCDKYNEDIPHGFLSMWTLKENHKFLFGSP